MKEEVTLMRLKKCYILAAIGFLLLLLYYGTCDDQPTKSHSDGKSIRGAEKSRSSSEAREVEVLWRDVYSVDVKGDIIFVGAYKAGLLTLDISHRFRQKKVNIRNVSGVKVWGDRAYGMGQDFLSVLDISNPRQPRLIGQGQLKGISAVRQGAMNRHWLYLACGEQGLKVVDVAKPNTPKVVGEVPPTPPGPDYSAGPKPKTEGIAVLSNIAYLLDDNGALRVMDMSNPASPQLVRRLDVSVGWGRLLRRGRTLFAAGSANEAIFEVLDLTNMRAPRKAGFWKGRRRSKVDAFTVQGDFAYLADSSHVEGGSPQIGLHVLDISDIKSPKEVHFFDMSYMVKGKPRTDVHFYDIAVSSKYAYIAAGHAGLRILDLSPFIPQS